MDSLVINNENFHILAGTLICKGGLASVPTHGFSLNFA